MQIKPEPIHLLPTKPQLHSHKHHNAYNGSRHLPIAVRVRRSTAASRPNQPDDDSDCCHLRLPGLPHRRRHLYAVTLFYERNRACTVFRTRDDFIALERGLTARTWRGPAPGERVHVHDLQRLLGEAVAKQPQECALEYFLRRRMGDCGY